MIKATINTKKEFEVDQYSLNGEAVEFDLVKSSGNNFHIIKNNTGYAATLISYNPEEKLMVIRVNDTEYEVKIQDKTDLLLQKLGINTTTSSAVSNVKAPMPGLIINIAVNTGDEVSKGDTLLILEAMKMENVIKSPRDGKIKKINIELRKAVEKNHILIEFE
ncbi:MAG: biotin/lipoyl-binding protein [Bacteroidetes bacterium]|nr:biotin/lipoyl-binding protein [Bacteroidota bacterium]MBK8658825.1 biotin/lipoyl-binding protein [Bacteroidota bacterium]